MEVCPDLDDSVLLLCFDVPQKHKGILCLINQPAFEVFLCSTAQSLLSFYRDLLRLIISDNIPSQRQQRQNQKQLIMYTEYRALSCCFSVFKGAWFGFMLTKCFYWTSTSVFLAQAHLVFWWLVVNLTALKWEESHSKGCVTADYQDLWLPACSDQKCKAPGTVMLCANSTLRDVLVSSNMIYIVHTSSRKKSFTVFIIIHTQACVVLDVTNGQQPPTHTSFVVCHCISQALQFTLLLKSLTCLHYSLSECT